MASKHIIYVHGRNTKPQPTALRRLIRRALAGGLRRVDREAADVFESPAIRFTLAYYGDIMNQLMIGADSALEQIMIRRKGKWYERSGRDDTNLEQLLARPTRRHTEEDYKEIARKHRNRRFWNEAARLVGPLASATGLTMYAVKRLFPDFAAYLTTRRWASEIRMRLQGRLRRALARNDDIALISHSMGCVVSYDVLWKLSRLSEHRAVRDRKVSLWLTMGSPLGESTIQDSLYDSNEPQDGRYPSNISDWVNVAAVDDMAAHDGTVADDFEEMRERRLVRQIKDLPRIYTFWVGAKGSNPHKSYGYLNHPATARVLAKWIK